MDLNAAGATLAALIAEIDSTIVTYGWSPDSVVTPCVFPQSWEVDYTSDLVMLGGDAAPVTFTVWLLVSKADDRSGQVKLQEYAGQVRAAIYADSTLSGECSDLQVTAQRKLGVQEYAGTDYLCLEVSVVALG